MVVKGENFPARAPKNGAKVSRIGFSSGKDSSVALNSSTDSPLDYGIWNDGGVADKQGRSKGGTSVVFSSEDNISTIASPVSSVVNDGADGGSFGSCGGDTNSDDVSRFGDDDVFVGSCKGNDSGDDDLEGGRRRWKR